MKSAQTHYPTKDISFIRISSRDRRLIPGEFTECKRILITSNAHPVNYVNNQQNNYLLPSQVVHETNITI